MKPFSKHLWGKWSKSLYFLLIIPIVTMAVAVPTTQDYADVAHKIIQPLLAVTKLVRVVCLVAGIGLLVGAIIRYRQHRNNPVEVSLSSCVAMVLAGIALIALTFVPIPVQ